MAVLGDKYLSNTNLWKTHQECAAEADEIEPYQRRAAYCKKNYALITRNRYQEGSTVLVGGELGTVKPYSDKAAAYLQKVEIKLNNGSVIKRYPTEIELVPERSTQAGRETRPGETSTNKRAKILNFCLGKEVLSVEEIPGAREDRSEIKSVPISAIIRDWTTQQRIALNHETVKEYAESMKEGDRFPPVKLIFDGNDYWLTDGFHTTEAAWSIGKTEVEAEITEGTKRDAVLASVGVNADHGLRRSNSDKRKAVTTLLEDSEWSQWSDREIAKRCKVSHPFVSKLRSSLTGNVTSEDLKNDNQILTGNVTSENNRIYQDKHGNEAVMNTANIGKSLNQDSNLHTEKAVSCINQATHKLNNSDLVESFEVGQLVKLQLSNFDGVSEQLKLKNHSYAQISAFTESGCSIRISIIGSKQSYIVSPQDLQKVDVVDVNVSFSSKQFIALASIYGSKDEIINAMKAVVLGK